MRTALQNWSARTKPWNWRQDSYRSAVQEISTLSKQSPRIPLGNEQFLEILISAIFIQHSWGQPYTWRNLTGNMNKLLKTSLMMKNFLSENNFSLQEKKSALISSTCLLDCRLSMTWGDLQIVLNCPTLLPTWAPALVWICALPPHILGEKFQSSMEFYGMTTGNSEWQAALHLLDVDLRESFVPRWYSSKNEVDQICVDNFTTAKPCMVLDSRVNNSRKEGCVSWGPFTASSSRTHIIIKTIFCYFVHHQIYKVQIY